MFTWAALPQDMTEAPVAGGISDGLESAQEAAAGFISDGRAMLAYVSEVRRVPGGDLSMDHVATARCWWGKLTEAGEMRWFPSPAAAALQRP